MGRWGMGRDLFSSTANHSLLVDLWLSSGCQYGAFGGKKVGTGHVVRVRSSGMEHHSIMSVLGIQNLAVLHHRHHGEMKFVWADGYEGLSIVFVSNDPSVTNSYNICHDQSGHYTPFLHRQPRSIHPMDAGRQIWDILVYAGWRRLPNHPAADS